MNPKLCPIISLLIINLFCTPSPNDVPHVVSSHQFPEDPEALAKEIKKYEGLLEQAHLQLKSTKKINKKQEELLWELQIRLTQLKVNIISS